MPAVMSAISDCSVGSFRSKSIVCVIQSRTGVSVPSGDRPWPGLR
jgi:hypothetical protein